MNFSFNCPGCGATYTVSQKLAGKKADCKKCGQRLDIPRPPSSKTMLGEAIVLSEPFESQSYKPSGQSEPEIPIAEANQTPNDYPGEYLPPIRSAAKSRQIIFLIFGGVTFVGLGVLILIMIANRGKELKSDVAAKKENKSQTKSKAQETPQKPTQNSNSTKPALEDEPFRKEVNSGPDAGDVAAGLMGIVFVILLIVVCFAVYFLPTIIALIRGHDNLLAVIMMNLLLGWIFVGWAIAMIWACWNKKPMVHKHYHYER